MLAVAKGSHVPLTTLMDAATLSQAHLIQPGRVLKAELQVQFLLLKVVQLHL